MCAGVPTLIFDFVQFCATYLRHTPMSINDISIFPACDTHVSTIVCLIESQIVSLPTFRKSQHDDVDRFTVRCAVYDI